jgi:hypothetical protein
MQALLRERSDIFMKRIERVYDKDVPYWTNSREANVMFIQIVENNLKSRLEHSSWVSLNDGFDGLGFPRTIEGQMFVWKKKNISFTLIPINEHDIKIIFEGLIPLF